jgi:hypothetical protein
VSKILKNKPFVEMDDLELMRAWDSIQLPLNKAILEEARAGMPLQFAVSILTLANGKRCISYHAAEAGDGEASREISEFVEEAKEFLEPGESIEFGLYEVPTDIRLVLAKVGRGRKV